jgi:hypothetical protein
MLLTPEEQDRLRTQLVDFPFILQLHTTVSVNGLGELVLTHVHEGRMVVSDKLPKPVRAEMEARSKQLIGATLKTALENALANDEVRHGPRKPQGLIVTPKG